MVWKITGSSRPLDAEQDETPGAHGTSWYTSEAAAYYRLDGLLYGNELEQAIKEGGQFKGHWTRVDGTIATDIITVEIVDQVPNI